jgi:ferric enterobactin transport system ATP-binding protein
MQLDRRQFELADRPVDTLSGGQRQRVWIAMVLAQQTPLLLLDEPTTWLDISASDRLAGTDAPDLNRETWPHAGGGAARSQPRLPLCHASDCHARRQSGRRGCADQEIVTHCELIEEVFGLRCMIIDDPVSHTPLVVPLGK